MVAVMAGAIVTVMKIIKIVAMNAAMDTTTIVAVLDVISVMNFFIITIELLIGLWILWQMICQLWRF